MRTDEEIIAKENMKFVAKELLEIDHKRAASPRALARG